jgi:adenylate kinase family enzyme
MTMAQFDRLHLYLQDHTRLFPKLVPALKNLSEFVGHDDIKETISKMVLYFIAQCSKQPRRSKRRRSSRKKTPVKRQRTFSSATSDEEAEDGDYDPEIDSAGMALIALLTQSLQGGDEDSSDDEETEDPPYVAQCRTKLNLLHGHFVHTLLLGKPGSGKTTFASLLVDVWDALGIVDKRRYKITKRSDWVGKYQGHSVAKAKKLIDSAKGGVIFIDEAYSIISSKDGDDMYGREVLTEIVEAMSNPDKQVIFIMAGYEQDMKQLFSHNAGLERRFGYVYRFKTPAAVILETIFLQQLLECRWKLDKQDRMLMKNFFHRNFKHLKYGGGSTKQLLFHSQQNAVVRQFPTTSENILTFQDIEDGMKTFLQHAQVFTAPTPPMNMYL